MATTLRKRLSVVEAQRVDTAEMVDGPTPVEIWLWKLQDVVGGLINSKQTTPYPEPGGYDHCFLYAHRDCLRTKEAVQAAPDDVLLAALGLGKADRWGWLQFMVRELGWFGMIAANWGWPILSIPDGVTYDPTTAEQRRRQVVAYFIELMRERGADPLSPLSAMRDKMADRFKRIHGVELDEQRFLTWPERHNAWAYYVYAFGDKPNPPDVLTAKKAPAYSGAHEIEFRAQIRAAAARRRQVWNAPHSCDCREREAVERDAP